MSVAFVPVAGGSKDVPERSNASTKNAFAGDTAEKLKAQFNALKKEHPQLGDRAIIALLKHQAGIRREAERLGFGVSEKGVAR